MLVVVYGNDFKASNIILWSLKTFSIIETLECADLNEINKIKEIYDFGPLEKSGNRYFVTAGKSSVIKVWQISKATKPRLTEVGEIFITNQTPTVEENKIVDS